MSFRVVWNDANDGISCDVFEANMWSGPQVVVQLPFGISSKRRERDMRELLQLRAAQEAHAPTT